MRCGLLSGTKATHAGSGMPSITTQERALAYVFGRRQDTVFLKLKALLEPFWDHTLLYGLLGRLQRVI